MTKFEFSTPSPTTIRIVRILKAPVALVWRAHTEPELVKQWASGPPDHTLPVCEIDLRVGGKARYVWKNPQFEMGMTAEFHEIVEHERIVHTEVFDGWPEGTTSVTTNFVEHSNGTKITIDLEYLTQEARDTVMQPGFREGYAASYENLDKLVAEFSQTSD